MGVQVFFIGFAAVIAAMYAWWSDVVREAQHQGHHTPVVQLHHR
jgi:cytochrome c oxidase subunit 3